MNGPLYFQFRELGHRRLRGQVETSHQLALIDEFVNKSSGRGVQEVVVLGLCYDDLTPYYSDPVDA